MIGGEVNDKLFRRATETAVELNHADLYEACKEYVEAVDNYNMNVGDISLLCEANNLAMKIIRMTSSTGGEK